MTAEPAPRRIDLEEANVLLVDDEPSVVAGLRRQLHGRFVIHTAAGPFEALDLLESCPEFAVVVSDMQMPSMNGAALLRRVRERSPNTVRVLLTGQADIDAAVEAINQGSIFRFLWKPCDPQTLLSCVQDAVVQHQLITAERELQERTLRASIRALLDTLALANPAAFTRANRIKRRVVELAAALDATDAWQVEIASMLAQLGTVSLPAEIVEQLHRGEVLGRAQQEFVDQLPDRAVTILADIPRLGAVRDMIRFQRQRFDGRGPVAVGLQGKNIPFGARLLAVATAYDAFDAQGAAPQEGIAALRSDLGRFDPAIVEALDAILTRDQDHRPIRKLRLADLKVGMVLAADVKTTDGVLLCGRGQEITLRVLDRLHNWSDVSEPLTVWA